MAQFLGNRNLLTLEECDDCNAAAGEHESALAALLAPARVLQQHRGRQRAAATFKHSKHTSRLRAIDSNNRISVVQSCGQNEPMLIDGALMRTLADPSAGERELAALMNSAGGIKKHELVLRVPVPAFRPIDAVMAMARLALIVEPKLRSPYDHLRRWLLGELDLPRQLLWHTTVSSIRLLQLVLVTQHECEKNETKHAVMLAFENKLLWYPLPPSTTRVRATYVPLVEAKESEAKWRCELIDADSISKEHHVEISACFSGTVTLESKSGANQTR